MHESKVVVIALANLVIFPHNNFSRKDGNWFADELDQKNLIIDLFDGINPVLSNFLFRELSKEERDSGLEQRKKELEELELLKTDFSIKFSGDESATIITPSERLRVFKELYMPKGKLITPTHEPIYAYRRLSSLGLVNTFRFKKGLSIITEVPGSIKFYPDTLQGKLDRIDDCVTENEGKDRGAKKIDWKDRCRAGYEMLVSGANEARFRKVFGVGNGQKVFKIMELNKKFPEIAILDSVENGTLNATSWDKEDMRELLAKGEAQDKVLDYLKNPKGGSSPVQMMAKKDIKAFSEDTYPCDLVAYICKGILNQTLPSDLRKIEHLFKALNEVTAPVLRKPVQIVKENAVALEAAIK